MRVDGEIRREMSVDDNRYTFANVKLIPTLTYKYEMDQPNEIIPGLFVGNMYAAADSNFFNTHSIGAVLNATPDVPHYFATQKGEVEYMRVNVNDSLKVEDFNKMFKYFPSGVSFIYKNLNLEGKNVLVHCHAGVQRSAALVVAYLMFIYKMSLRKAIDFVILKRPVAFSFGKSINFMSSLTKFAQFHKIPLN